MGWCNLPMEKNALSAMFFEKIGWNGKLRFTNEKLGPKKEDNQTETTLAILEYRFGRSSFWVSLMWPHLLNLVRGWYALTYVGILTICGGTSY